MWFDIGAHIRSVADLYKNSNVYKIFKYHFKIITYHVLCLLFSLFCLPYALVKGRHYSNGQISARILTQISKICDIEWRLRNEEFLAKDRGAVIISNHQNVFDLLGAVSAFKVAAKVVLVAKNSLMYAGPFGLLAYLCGTVFIDRSNPKSAYKDVYATTEMIKKFKVKVWFYPEGTRNVKKTEKMLPFKKGAFQLAVAAQVPIIPVVYSPYSFIDRNKFLFDKGYVIMQCLEPVPTAGLTFDDVPVLMTRLHDIMTNAYDQLTTEVMTNAPAEGEKY